jgi:uncharacterized protein (DUF58 family)
MRGRLFLLSLVAVLLLLAGLITLNGPLLALVLLYAVYLAASLPGAPRTVSLEVDRTLSAERVGADMPVDVTVTVRNRGPALEELLVEDELPDGLAVSAGSPRRLLRLPEGGRFQWTYSIRGGRGFYIFPGLAARAGQPLGLITRAASYPIPGQLFILPPVLPLRNVSIRPRRTRVYSGIVPAHSGGPGVEFYDIREYQAGDPTKWIDWHTSARHPGRLYSKEFEQERVADVGIILDGRLRANVVASGRSLFEHSALAAASLAEAFLGQGNRVSLLIYGQYVQWTLPGYGKLQRERILRALARAQLGGSQIFSNLDHIPTRLFPAQSQVVIVTPLTADDPEVLVKLRARGYRVLLISPNPVSFEVSFLPEGPEVALASRILGLERALMLRQLRRAGIELVDWDVSKPFDQAVNRRTGRLLQPLRGGGR